MRHRANNLRKSQVRLASDVFVSTDMSIPIRIEIEKELMKVGATCYVKIGGGTGRLATDGEVEVKLWGGGAYTANATTGEVLTYSPTWGTIPLQPVHTKGGFIYIGEPAWGSDRYGTEIPVANGAFKISARHYASGATVFRFFRVASLSLVSYAYGEVTQHVLDAPGNPMPPGFQQPTGLAPYSSIPSVEWSPGGWYLRQ